MMPAASFGARQSGGDKATIPSLWYATMIGNGLRKRLSPFRYEDFRTVDRRDGERIVESSPPPERPRRSAAALLPGFVLHDEPAACAGECAGRYDSLHERTGLCLACLLGTGWTPGLEVESMTNGQRGRAIRVVSLAWNQPKEDVAAFVVECSLELGRPFDSVLADFVAECGDYGSHGECEPTPHEKRVYACRLAKLRRLRDQLAKSGRPYASAFDHPAAPEIWEFQQRRLGLSSKQGARAGAAKKRKREVVAA